MLVAPSAFRLGLGGLALLAAACLAAPPLRAGERQPAPVAPSLEGLALAAGDEVELRFALPTGSDVDEWEAFLSIDGGATYPIRLTEERPAAETSFRFRVPNLPAASARVLVRSGGEEDGGRTERDVALSAAFRIEGRPGVAPALPRPDAGTAHRLGDHARIEWWLEDWPVPGPSLPLEAGSLSSRPTVRPVGGDAEAAANDSRPPIQPPLAGRFPRPVRGPARAASPPSPARSAVLPPLRI